VRHAALTLLVLSACADKAGDDVDTDTEIVDSDTDVVDTDVVDSDVVDSDTDVAVTTCAVDHGGCDEHATCEDGEGGAVCTCPASYTGDGTTCTIGDGEDYRACEILQAEHPGYTTIARDVALCGARYDATNLATACHVGWHVCRESEWTARYPIRTYKADPSDPDTIGPTIGTLTSWGAPQSERCGGGVWLANAPEDDKTWDESVCYDEDAGPGESADYLPWDDVKVILGDDGTTILQGVDQWDQVDCCNWDVRFEAIPADDTDADAWDDFAVYCCRD
jgi:hypothetical protein